VFSPAMSISFRGSVKFCPCPHYTQNGHTASMHHSRISVTNGFFASRWSRKPSGRQNSAWIELVAEPNTLK
jgi:hypothetical protein